MNAEIRLANLLGAAAVGLGDALDAAIDAEPSLDRSAATALVALTDCAYSGSVRRLSDVLGLTHSGAVRLLDRLAAAGYVDREPGPDARSVAVQLTAKGRRAARRLRRRRQSALAAALAGLSRRQRAELADVCALIIANLVQQRLAMRAAGLRPPGGALCRMCDFGACGRADGRCPAAAAALRRRVPNALS